MSHQYRPGLWIGILLFVLYHVMRWWPSGALAAYLPWVTCWCTLPPRLAALEELDCSLNEIEALPPSMGQCINLRTFAADHNFLTQLPPEVRMGPSATRPC